MRKLLVGGNWKQNGTVQFAKEFPEKVLNKIKFDSNKVEVVIAPTALHIPLVKQTLQNNVQISAQNIS
jgi:triosephosphate isomerase